jgi:hypothetical protein
MAPSNRYLEQARALMGEGTENENPRGAGNGLAGLHRAGRQLEAASSSLRSLLDDPIPNLSSPVLEAEYSSEAEHNRRVKRRKLDSDRVDAPFAGFNYGKYGQVEPGKLKMEIVSCDGGIFQEHSGNYAAENVLKNDGTVYCTKSNRCNLVLRHQGATVFSLKELIIKAPHSGYTAPYVHLSEPPKKTNVSQCPRRNGLHLYDFRRPPSPYRPISNPILPRSPTTWLLRTPSHFRPLQQRRYHDHCSSSCSSALRDRRSRRRLRLPQRSPAIRFYTQPAPFPSHNRMQRFRRRGNTTTTLPTAP